MDTRGGTSVSRPACTLEVPPRVSICPRRVPKDTRRLVSLCHTLGPGTWGNEASQTPRRRGTRGAAGHEDSRTPRRLGAHIYPRRLGASSRVRTLTRAPRRPTEGPTVFLCGGKSTVVGADHGVGAGGWCPHNSSRSKPPKKSPKNTFLGPKP